MQPPASLDQNAQHAQLHKLALATAGAILADVEGHAAKDEGDARKLVLVSQLLEIVGPPPPTPR